MPEIIDKLRIIHIMYVCELDLLGFRACRSCKQLWLPLTLDELGIYVKQTDEDVN